MSFDRNLYAFIPVLWIRIRMDPDLLPGSRSGIIVLDPDPAKSETVNSGLFVLLDNREWQIIVKIPLFD